MSRSLRALSLLVRLFVSYAWQWLLVKTVGSRRFGARWDRVHTRNAQRVAASFTGLRGGFIKLGQVIAVIGGFLPEAYRQHLSALQDRVPPRPFAEIETRLKTALGPNAVELFGELDRQPIAAASLAQVHRATLPDGRQVAVKVLYPGIEALIEADLRTLRWLLPLLRFLFPIQGLQRVHEQLGSMLRRETNYDREERNMRRVRGFFQDRSDVVVPSVVPELTGEAVLTMSYESGCSLGDRAELERQGIDPVAVARLLTRCYLTMLFEHRHFHADPHPGNFLVRPGPTLVILDYGAVEMVTPNLVEGLTLAAMGALCRNPEQVLDGAEMMGFAAPDADRELLRSTGLKVLKSLGKLNISNYEKLDPRQVRKQVAPPLSELRPLLRHMQYPEGFFYVERTLGLLFGLIAQLAPSQGLPGIGAPLLSRFMLKRVAAKPPAPAPANKQALEDRPE